MKLGLIVFTALSAKLTHLNVFACYDLSLNGGNRKYAIKLYISMCARRVWKNFASAKALKLCSESTREGKENSRVRKKTYRKRVRADFVEKFASAFIALVADTRKTPHVRHYTAVGYRNAGFESICSFQFLLFACVRCFSKGIFFFC